MSTIGKFSQEYVHNNTMGMLCTLGSIYLTGLVHIDHNTLPIQLYSPNSNLDGFVVVEAGAVTVSDIMNT